MVSVYIPAIIAQACPTMPCISPSNWGEPHTSESDGTSDRLRTITIKHGKLVYSSIDNLNYTKNSQNGLLTIYLTKMAR